MRVAFLGPPGTFSEEALALCDLTAGAERRDLPTIAEAFEAALRGECQAALLPMENSLEGTVSATLDLLVHRPGLRIRREVFLPVRQNLLARPGTTLEEVRRVVSVPIALAQCQVFLRAHLPGAALEHAPSTADAARRAAGEPGAAAVASRAAAERYGLALLREGIQDGDANVTRFVLVMREDERPTGRDRPASPSRSTATGPAGSTRSWASSPGAASTSPRSRAGPTSRPWATTSSSSTSRSTGRTRRERRRWPACSSAFTACTCWDPTRAASPRPERYGFQVSISPA
jgi:prephenate dehydratase